MGFNSAFKGLKIRARKIELIWKETLVFRAIAQRRLLVTDVGSWLLLWEPIAARGFPTSLCTLSVPDILLGLLGPWRWKRFVVPKRRYLTTYLPCVTSQKSEDLMYIAAEAWNQAPVLLLPLPAWLPMLNFSLQNIVRNILPTFGKRSNFPFVSFIFS